MTDDKLKIALLGDYQESVMAHRAVPQALDLAARALALEIEVAWWHSSEADRCELGQYDALWSVPFSPYQEPQAVIGAIRRARESNMPFLGTCAGYQHALIEFARNRLGISGAESSEDNPDCEMPLIHALSCRLTDEGAAINLKRNSRVGGIYQSEGIFEEYNCGFGMNPDYLSLFEGSGLEFVGFDDEGDPRVFEVPENDFFVGTAFQPERSALAGQTHPLIVAFLLAAQ